MNIISPLKQEQRSRVAPVRLGFAGVGWIGLNRLQAACTSENAVASAVFDPNPEAIAKAREAAPDAEPVSSFEELIEQELDAVVIATPSALHAEQSIAALERGIAVFCQKPLARTYDETHAVIEAAQAADRLLMTDLSYRFIRGVDRMSDLISQGELGEIFAVDLTFHNAYGPDKSWFYDYRLSGGGCLIDLGTHLVDLALHLLGRPSVRELDSQLYRQGKRLPKPTTEVEDFASVTWNVDDGPTVRLACSWNLSAGRDAIIEAVFYGTAGSVALRNENGSFVDFTTERCRGTQREQLCEPDRGWSWGGGAICDFVRRLGGGGTYDSGCETLFDVASVLDRSYGR